MHNNIDNITLLSKVSSNQWKILLLVSHYMTAHAWVGLSYRNITDLSVVMQTLTLPLAVSNLLQPCYSRYYFVSKEVSNELALS